MKVLQVGKYYYPSRGGIETVVQNLAEGLAIKKISVSLLAYSEGRRGESTGRNGVAIRRLGTWGKLFSQPLSLRFPFLARRLAGVHDLVHLHSPNPVAELALGGLPRGIPLVVTYHSDIVVQRWLMPFYAPVLRRLLRRADRIVVASQEQLDNSPVLGEFRDKCAVIPFGLDPARYAAPAGVRAPAPSVLFIGRMVHYKGVDVLLRAIRGTELKLRLVGDGPRRRSYEALARELGVAGQAEFLGAVAEQERLLAELHACEMLVLPSRSVNEAFGMVLLEAMACGKPVVSSRLPTGIRFVNKDAASGIQVTPESVEELRAALLRLHRDPQERSRLASGARRRFEEHFTLDAMLAAYLRVYASLGVRA